MHILNQYLYMMCQELYWFSPVKLLEPDKIDTNIWIIFCMLSFFIPFLVFQWSNRQLKCGYSKNHHISQVTSSSLNNYSKGCNTAFIVPSWLSIHIEHFHTHLTVIIILYSSQPLYEVWWQIEQFCQ